MKNMKYMRVFLSGAVCVMMMGALVGCGDDTMNSATDGTKNDDMLDSTIEDMYEGDTLMDDLENGVDHVIDGTEDVLDDVMDGTDNMVDDMGNTLDSNADTYMDGTDEIGNYDTQMEVEEGVIAD